MRRRFHLVTPSPCHLVTAAITLLTLAAPSRADWTLTTADFARQSNLNINTFNAAEGLSATDATSKLLHLDTRDIVSLYSGKNIANDTALLRFKLSLRNGDVLFGDPVGITGQSLKFRLIDSRSVLSIPLKTVALLSSPKSEGAAAAPIAAAASDQDTVQLANNDRREGILVAIDSARLQLVPTGSDTPIDIPLSSVAAVSLGGAAAPRAVPPLSVRLNLISGSILTIPLTPERAFNWTLSTVKFKDAAGEDHALDTDRIASLEVLGGKLVYLTDIDPASETQTSFLGTPWPMQINKNVLGEPARDHPLKVKDITYPRGIGVHTQSTLVYELDGSFDTLTLKVALDDSAAPQGEAKASVVLDGKTLWQSDTLRPGQITPELNLPITGGKRLELHADPTTHLDVLGRLDWLNIALRRK